MTKTTNPPPQCHSTEPPSAPTSPPPTTAQPTPSSPPHPLPDRYLRTHDRHRLPGPRRPCHNPHLRHRGPLSDPGFPFGANFQTAATEADGPKPKILCCAIDIAFPESVAALRNEVAKAFGGLDVLVNNAAQQEPCAPLLNTDMVDLLAHAGGEWWPGGHGAGIPDDAPCVPGRRQGA
ncbi:Hypothetical protein D9617_11g007560 [Elsinoe fawcettii]|nr:Hypothetical protein D9617_11g007560 [Elsinoe fawcettii]